MSLLILARALENPTTIFYKQIKRLIEDDQKS